MIINFKYLDGRMWQDIDETTRNFLLEGVEVIKQEGETGVIRLSVEPLAVPCTIKGHDITVEDGDVVAILADDIESYVGKLGREVGNVSDGEYVDMGEFGIAFLTPDELCGVNVGEDDWDYAIDECNDL